MILFILLINLFIVIAVAQSAKQTGRNWLVWAVVVFIFGIFGLALYLYDLTRYPADTQAKQEQQSFRVYGDVVDNNDQEKTVGMTFQSNWTKSEAKEAFRESCAEEGLVLTGKPTVTVESDKPDEKEKNSSKGDETEKIRRLKELRDSGAITEEEFQEKKTVLLNRL